MGRKTIRRFVGAVLSVTAATALAGGPLVYGMCRRPATADPDTPITNSGITVNALNPSDDIHQVASNVDPTNHQDSSRFPNTYAQFVISLSGISSGGSNYTAPITAHWSTEAGSFPDYSSGSGVVSFPSRYTQHYQFVNIPVRYDSALYARGTGVYQSFNLIISSATNASIGRGTATVYVVNGVHGPNLP